MKTNVRESSIDCYHGIDLNRGQAKVIEFLMANPGDYTRGELAKESGIPINAICGRTFELIESGALEERPVKRADRYTGRQCFAVRLAPRQAALELA